MKALASLLRFVLFLGLVLVTSYNVWQVQVLRGEVDLLKRQVKAKASGGKVAPRPGPIASLQRLKDARKHAENAQTLLKAGKYDDARREMVLAAEVTQEASDGVAHPDTEGVAADLRRALDSLGKQAGALWERPKDASGPGAGEPRENVEAHTKGDTKR